MSYYFEQKWYQVTHTSGRKRMLCVLQESHEGFLGHDWDIEAEAKSKTTKFVPRSSIEEMLEIPPDEVHGKAIEVRTISRSRKVKRPASDEFPDT